MLASILAVLLRAWEVGEADQGCLDSGAVMRCGGRVLWLPLASGPPTADCHNALWGGAGLLVR